MLDHLTRRHWHLRYAAKFIAKKEGFVPYAYLDTIASPPVWTIGFGSTHNVRSGMRWSRRKAERELAKEMRWAAEAVARNVHVPLTFRQRIALISLVYNCGAGAIEGSEIQRALNRKKYKLAADKFLDWSHAGGVVIPGLLARRQEERWMFLHNKKGHK